MTAWDLRLWLPLTSSPPPPEQAAELGRIMDFAEIEHQGLSVPSSQLLQTRLKLARMHLPRMSRFPPKSQPDVEGVKHDLQVTISRIPGVESCEILVQRQPNFPFEQDHVLIVLEGDLSQVDPHALGHLVELIDPYGHASIVDNTSGGQLTVGACPYSAGAP